MFFFGYQIAIRFVTANSDAYWESFLAFTYETDKKLSWEDRIKDCRERFPQKWINYVGDLEEIVDYWDLILKEQYK